MQVGPAGHAGTVGQVDGGRAGGRPGATGQHSTLPLRTTTVCAPSSLPLRLSNSLPAGRCPGAGPGGEGGQGERAQHACRKQGDGEQAMAHGGSPGDAGWCKAGEWRWMLRCGRLSGPIPLLPAVSEPAIYDPAAVESAAQSFWARTRAFEVDDSPTPKYYCLSMLPYPSGRAARRPRAQLHHRRRDQPAQADDRFQRAAADGLGRILACLPRMPRSRTRPRRRSGPYANIEHIRAQLKSAGLYRSTGPASSPPQAGLLRPRAAHVRAPAEEGHRLPQELGGELGPGRPDRAGQRAGDRRPRADRRAGREARDPAVVPAHHRRIRAGTAG